MFQYTAVAFGLIDTRLTQAKEKGATTSRDGQDVALATQPNAPNGSAHDSNGQLSPRRSRWSHTLLRLPSL